ncbi:MAG: glycosyltransferase family 1 protein [Acidimicrobiales bacterium]|jgi:glycosyltransferase involved in cell wall biosynthesis
MTTIKVDGSVLGWGSGGISRYLENVLRHLVEEPDIKIELFANSHRRVIDLPQITEHDIRVKGGPVWRASVLSYELWRRPPDVYWLPTASPPPFMSRPYVVTVHDIAPILFPGSKRALGTFAFGTAYRRAVTRADHVLAVSESTADDIMRYWAIPEERITVTPLGVSERFTPGDHEESRTVVEKRWGLKGPFALVVGTLEERKGLDLAIDIAAADHDLKLVFVGRNGFGSETIVERGRRLGAVFLGEIEDTELVDLYRSADILLAPSIYEGFGLTPLEAMACGCPVVIAGGSGSLHQIYEGAAKIVSKRSPDTWIPAMRQVAGERGKWVEAGSQLARRYTWAKTAFVTAQVLRRVAAGELRNNA